MATSIVLDHEITTGTVLRIDRPLWSEGSLRHEPGRPWRRAYISGFGAHRFVVSHVYAERGVGCEQQFVQMFCTDPCWMELRVALPVDEYRAFVAEGAIVVVEASSKAKGDTCS